MHIGTVPIDHELLNRIIENQIEARREHRAGGFVPPVQKQGCLKSLTAAPGPDDERKQDGQAIKGGWWMFLALRGDEGRYQTAISTGSRW